MIKFRRIYSPDYDEPDLDLWIMILLDELFMNSDYIVGCALLLSFMMMGFIDLDVCLLYIIVFIFRKFSSSGEINSKGVRVHLLASDQESERRVVEREESIDGSVLGMEEETDSPELYLEMGNLLLDKEDDADDEPEKRIVKMKEPEPEKQKTNSVEFFSSEIMEASARERMVNRRKQAADTLDTFLIPQTSNVVWGENREISKVALVKKLIGYTPRMNRYRDNTCMRDYLDAVKDNGTQNLHVGKWSDFLPNGAALLDFLAVDATLPSGWIYPSRSVLKFYQENRALSLDMLEQVETKEITIGKSTTEEVLECHEWIKKRYETDQLVFPTGVIAMDVEEIKLSRMDELRLLGIIPIEKHPHIAADKLIDCEDRLPSMSKGPDKWRQIPVRIMIGNGVSWTFQIRLNLETMGKNYVIIKQSVSTEVLDLIRSIPVCTGLGVKSDVEDVERFYSELSGEQVKMKGWIGLDTVAVVAGYRMQALGMTPMAVQIIGTLLNKCASTGDGKWGREWKDIGKGLKVYAIGDIKFAHMAYHILAGALIRDIFPDPDVVCTFLGCFQSEGAAWFCELLLNSVRELEVDGAVVKKAETRKDLITALRGRTSSGVWTEGTPRRAWIWTRLFGNWPTITNGGARFLLQVREKCLAQVGEIKAARIRWKIDLDLPTIGEEEKLAALYGLDVTPAQWGSPVLSGELGLIRETSIVPPLLKFDPQVSQASYIAKKCLNNGSVQKLALREWARSFPEMVHGFLTRMKEDEIFCSRYEKLYDPLRLIAWRSRGSEPITIDKLEEGLNMKGDEMVDHEFCQMRKAEEMAAVWRSRWMKLKEAREKGGSVLRAKWRHTLPSMPDWKPKTRRGKKRGRLDRSRSRSRGRKNNRDATLVRVDIQTTGDTAVDNEVQVVEVEDEDLVHQCDEDGRNLLTGRARSSRSSKKRKGNQGTFVRTYDEMIEMEPYYSSDDEFNLELFVNDN